METVMLDQSLSKLPQQTPIKLLKKAQSLFRQGNLSSSTQIYQNLLSSFTNKDNTLTPNLHYDCLLNLSTIQLQNNNPQTSRKLLIRAIQLNSNRYEAFYNLAITNLYTQKHYSQSIHSLQYCLSLLYLNLGISTASLTHLNKSILLNPQNIKPYIHRGLLYEKNNKIKLAQNQFEQLTFQKDKNQFSTTILAEIYLQKSLFYRRVKKMDKMQDNLTHYLKLKNQLQNQNRHQQQHQMNQKVKEILQQNQQDNQSTTSNQKARKKIIDLLTEAQDLIKQINQPKVNKLKEQVTEQQRRQTVVFELSKQIMQQQPQSITSPLPQRWTNWEQNLLETDSPQKKLALQNSISINQDEDSAILNQKIEQLQRQIEQSGGKLPEVKQISRNQQEQDFLELQIQKTLQQISNKKVEDNKGKVKQFRRLQSLPTMSTPQVERKSTIQSPRSQRRSQTHQDRQDSMTLRSRISQAYQLNYQQIRGYNRFQLQIRSVSMFNEKSPRKQAYIRIRYLQRELVTEKCMNDKFTWNHTFDEQELKHRVQEQELLQHRVLEQDEVSYQLELELYAKEGGWLSWNNQVLLGRGVIKLTQKGGTKSALENKGQMVGMLYYKIKLKKLEQSNQKQ